MHGGPKLSWAVCVLSVAKQSAGFLHFHLLVFPVFFLHGNWQYGITGFTHHHHHQSPRTVIVISGGWEGFTFYLHGEAFYPFFNPLLHPPFYQYIVVGFSERRSERVRSNTV